MSNIDRSRSSSFSIWTDRLSPWGQVLFYWHWRCFLLHVTHKVRYHAFKPNHLKRSTWSLIWRANVLVFTSLWLWQCANAKPGVSANMFPVKIIQRAWWSWEDDYEVEVVYLNCCLSLCIRVMCEPLWVWLWCSEDLPVWLHVQILQELLFGLRDRLSYAQ